MRNPFDAPVPARPGTMFRQGDVLLVAIDESELVGRFDPVARHGSRVVLAEGEVTGHAHAVHAATAQLLEEHGKADVRVLRLAAPADLVHEEHAPIALPAGTYRIVIQREYVPSDVVATSWRRVVD